MYSTDYDEAVAWADGHGEVVNGTFRPDGEPVYFTTEPGLPDQDIMSEAFHVRNGRVMSKVELKMLEWFQRGEAVDDAD
jgi:hypothetical protein